VTVVRRHDLTAAEFAAISARYGPYDVLEEFWTGYDAYWDDNDRYRCPHGWTHSVASQAWHHGADAAMYVRWQRKLPARDACERDDRETALQIATLAEIIAERRKKNDDAASDRPVDR
jgi:hypothetical protein